MITPPTDSEPTRAEVDRLPGPVLLVFGASWCGFCRALEPELTAQLEKHPEVREIWVEDGPGRPLGRSFRVKLWPTLVFLQDGHVLKQVSRPGPDEVREGLALLSPNTTPGL